MPTYDLTIVLKARDYASGAFRRVEGAAESLRERISKLGMAAQVAAGFIGAQLAINAASAIQEFVGGSVKAFTSLEASIAQVVAAIGATGEEAEGLRVRIGELARSLSVEMGLSATQVVGALEALIKAGMEGEQAMSALRSALMLSKVEGISASEAANLLVSTLAQFGLAAEQASMAVDALTNASRLGIGAASEYAGGLAYVGAQAHSMGISLHETLSALVLIDATQKDAVKSGRYLNAMLSDLIQHSDELGFSLYDSGGRMLSLTDIVSRLTDRLDSLASEEERNAYLQRIFGEQGKRAALALIGQADALVGLTSKMSEAGTTTEMFSEIMDTFQGRQERVRAEWERFQIRVGEALIPALTKLFDVFEEKLLPVLERDLLPLIEGPLSDALIYLVDPVLIGLIDALKATGAAMASFGKGWALIVGSISEGVNMVSGSISMLTSSWISAMGSMRSALVSLSRLWGSVWGSMAEILESIYIRVIKPVIDAITSALNVISGIVGALSPPMGAIGASPSGSMASGPRIPRYREGGLVTKPTIALVGEAGPELIVPLSRLGRREALEVHIYVHDERVEFLKRWRRIA